MGNAESDYDTGYITIQAGKRKMLNRLIALAGLPVNLTPDPLAVLSGYCTFFLLVEINR